jgi:sugar phosphate isomerase/epimerase
MAELCFNTFNRSTYLIDDADLPAQIAAAADAGFTWFGPDTFSLTSWEQAGRSLEELRDIIVGHGLAVWEIAALNVGERDETLAQAAVIARQSAVLGPRWILTNVGAPVDASLCELFAEVCDLLATEGGGAKPAIEYLPFTPADSIAATMPLIDHVGTDRARILYDVWHHFRGPDTDAVHDAAPADTVAYVQFSDALPMIGDDLVHETLERRTFPGEGEFDLDGYCRRMRAKGFDGVVSVEILNGEWRRGDTREFARRAFTTTRRFWP